MMEFNIFTIVCIMCLSLNCLPFDSPLLFINLVLQHFNSPIKGRTIFNYQKYSLAVKSGIHSNLKWIIWSSWIFIASDLISFLWGRKFLQTLVNNLFYNLSRLLIKVFKVIRLWCKIMPFLTKILFLNG